MITALVLFLLSSSISMSVCEDTKGPLDLQITNYSYYVRNSSVDTYRPVYVTEYTITNVTHEMYYSWVDYDKPNYSEKKEAIHRFFFKRKGDFSFFDLMTDDIIMVNSDLCVGMNFIVQLQPNDSFKYIVVKDKPDDGQLRHYIESAPQKWIEEQVLQIPIPNSFKYSLPYIVIK